MQSKGSGNGVGPGGDSWQKALEYSKRLGYVPLAFPVAVRSLMADAKTKEGIIRPVTKYQVARVLRGPNFKAMLYYATELVSQDTLKGSLALTVGDLMDLFSPMDLASLLSCYVTNRLASKIAPKELKDAIRPALARETQVGALVGVAIPSLGIAGGLLWGSSRHIAHMLMSSDDPQRYIKWQKAAVGQNIATQAKLEHETWGCTSAQVASMVLAAMGLGKETAALLERAGAYEGPVTSIVETDLQRFRLAVLWFDCFASGKKQPIEKLPAKNFPFDSDRAKVNSALAKIDVSQPAWLERAAADISTTKTPQLFAKPKVDTKFEIPEGLEDVFKLEEITGMDEWDFDTLVAHMDRELEETSEADGVLSQKDLNKLEELVS